MPSEARQLAPANFTLDEANNMIRFERDVPASNDELFAAWTEPSQVAVWWDPSGAPLARCEIDLRPGGAFSFVSQGRPDQPFNGTYREIRRPDLLIFEALGASGRVAIASAVAGSRMTVEIVCSSPEHLRQFVAMGVANGTSQTLDNLVAFKSR